ncbi:hypothetical protein I4U23_005465 [Adineta vaga]|nr:hypothetical protein I4U23_005465 [Adineta vaga]
MIIMRIIHWIQKELVTLNVFESDSTDINTIQRERLSTRVYLSLMTIAFIALIIYTGFSVHTNTITVEYPNHRQFEDIFKQSFTSLRCDCWRVAIPYGTFVQINISFHSVCSSHFISLKWIESLYAANVTYIWPMDIRTILNAFWQLVAAFCQNFQDIIANTIDNFNISTILSLQLMSAVEVKIRTEAALQFMINTAKTTFARNLRAIRYITSNEKLISGLGINAHMDFPIYYTLTEGYPGLNFVSNIYDDCLCGKSSSIGCSKLSGFFEFAMWNTKGIYNDISANRTIPGIFFDCYPLDALLRSTFECYYQSTCLDILHPNLNITSLFLSISNRYPHMNTSIENMLNELFIEEIRLNTSFNLYYSQCKPSLCTYISTERFDFRFMFTTILAVFGGLVFILKFVTLFIVKLVLLVYHRRRQTMENVQATQSEQNYMKQKFMLFLRSVPNKIYILLLNLNIFNTYSRDEHVIYRQHISTRVYFICLIICISGLGVYTFFSSQLQNITVMNPSLSTYTYLYQSHSDSLKCECSQLSIAQNEFIEITPTLHQLCSSQFISSNWYNRLFDGNFSTQNLYYNSRRIKPSNFAVLESFCALANNTISDSLRIFNATQFINNDVLPQWQFEEQTQLFIDTFTNTTLSDFTNMFALLQSVTIANQLVTEPSSNAQIYLKPNGQIIMVSKLSFIIDYNHPYGSATFCSCAGDTSLCGTAVWFYYNSSSVQYFPRGLFSGCLRMDDALISTLECWFNKSCLTYIRNSFLMTGIEDMFDITPLNVSLTSRFYPNTTMRELMTQLLLESWTVHVSYEKFYYGCSPKTCTYTEKIRYDIILTILTIIAIYGGLNKGLRILVPWIVRFILRCLRLNYIQTNPRESDTSRSISAYKKFWSKFLLVNWFSKRSSTVNTVYQERLSTKLYIILFSLSIIGLVMYTSLIKRYHSEYLYNPSIQDFERLKSMYSNTLQCPCSKIAISHRLFITRLNASLHPICNSDYIKRSEWINWLGALNVPDNIAWVYPIDFRRWGTSLFIWIRSFCNLANSTISNSIRSFQSTSFITVQLLDRNEFESQTTIKINQLLINMRKNFIHTLQLNQDIVQGNAIMSIFSTNWLLKVKQYSNVSEKLFFTEPVIYNSSCSCATSRKCMQLAGIYSWNGTLLHTIDSVMYGCFLLESYLATSLSCFYSYSCLTSFFLSTKLGSPYGSNTAWYSPFARPDFSPLNASLLQHFSTEDTFTTIINELFIDSWLTNISYELFFTECAPRYCTYPVADRFDFLYVLTVFLSFYMAISLVLYLVIPHFIRIILLLNNRMRIRPQLS